MKLRVLQTADPALQGKTFELDRALRIGREELSNEIVIQEGRVSRRHAHLEQTDRGWMIVDDGSNNGVSVNQQRVAQQLLAPGDRIGIGETMLLFESSQEDVATVMEPLQPREAILATASEPPAAASHPAPMSPAVIQPVPPATSPAILPAAPTAASPPPKPASGCALGCLFFSIILFIATVGGSLFVLYRNGYLSGR